MCADLSYVMIMSSTAFRRTSEIHLMVYRLSKSKFDSYIRSTVVT